MNKINHLKSSFKKILKKIFLMREYRPIVNLDNKFQKRRIFNVIGGNLNPDKIFYVIQRYPGYGIFSISRTSAVEINRSLSFGALAMTLMKCPCRKSYCFMKFDPI